MPTVDPAREVRVLVVEDEGIVAHDVQRRLEQAGYGVCGVADNGDDAIVLALAERPDLVLMDIVIQGARDGIDTAQEIRRHLDVPIVFLTAHSDAATLSRARETLPYGYLVKPFEPRELVATIDTALYRHGAEARERVFRKALTAVGVGVAILDAAAPERVQTWVNPALCRMLGYSEEELLGRPCPLLESLANHGSLAGELAQSIASGKDFRTTGQLQRKDGSRFHDQLVLSPVRDGAGHVAQLIAVHQDVTAQMEYEQELESRVQERTEELKRIRLSLEQAQEVAGLASWEYEVATGELRTSENLPELIGVPREKLRTHSRNSLELVFPDDLEERKACNAEILAGREVRNFEFRVRHPHDGELQWQSLMARPQLDEQGNLVRVIGTLQDVTERKELESRLQHNLNDMHSLLDASPVGIAFFRGGAIRSCNQAYTKILGWSVDELLGRPYGEVFQVRDLVNWDHLVQDHAASPDKKSEREFEVRRKDGSWGWVRVLNASIDKNDVMGGTVVICDDITQQKAMQQELKARLALLDSIFSASPLGIAFFVNQRLVRCNEAYASLYGWTPEEMQGRFFDEWWKPTDRRSTYDELTRRR